MNPDVPTNSAISTPTHTAQGQVETAVQTAADGSAVAVVESPGGIAQRELFLNVPEGCPLVFVDTEDVVVGATVELVAPSGVVVASLIDGRLESDGLEELPTEAWLRRELNTSRSPALMAWRPAK